MTAWGWVRKVGLLVLTVALVEYLAVPQLLKARAPVPTDDRARRPT